MDISGNNRYELLFVDDDLSSSPVRGESVGTKKLVGALIFDNKKSSGGAKRSGNVDKENKSGALNEGELRTKNIVYHIKPKHGVSETVFDKSNSELEKSCKVEFKSQNELWEQKSNCRNIGGGVPHGIEFGNEQRETRQFRDRESKGPARNRQGASRGGKREFDRQSGSDKTGVKAIVKRDGAGAHNWGSVKQEIDDINKSMTDDDATLAGKDESSNEQTHEEPAITEQEEIKELTLDEWKAMRGERTKLQYNIRKANEGEDTSEWKKMTVLNKKKENDSEEEYEYDPSMYPQRVGRLQRIVDIQFNFNDSRRGGFGRGRGRGPRSGGEFKGPCREGDRHKHNCDERQQKRSQSAFKIDDERQFPTLS